jgi:hypothetical protein
MAVNRFRAVMSGIRLRVERSARNPLILVAAMAAALALGGAPAGRQLAAGRTRADYDFGASSTRAD